MSRSASCCEVVAPNAAKDDEDEEDDEEDDENEDEAAAAAGDDFSGESSCSAAADTNFDARFGCVVAAADAECLEPLPTASAASCGNNAQMCWSTSVADLTWISAAPPYRLRALAIVSAPTVASYDRMELVCVSSTSSLLDIS